MIASIEKQENRKRNNIVMTNVLQWRCVDAVFSLLVKRYPYSIRNWYLTIAPTSSFDVILLPVRIQYEYDRSFLQYEYIPFFLILFLLLYEYDRSFTDASFYLFSILVVVRIRSILLFLLLLLVRIRSILLFLILLAVRMQPFVSLRVIDRFTASLSSYEH